MAETQPPSSAAVLADTPGFIVYLTLVFKLVYIEQGETSVNILVVIVFAVVDNYRWCLQYSRWSRRRH